ARQFVDHEHALGHLEFGQTPIERLHHGSFADVGAFGADHHGGDAFTEIRMRYADYSGFDHAGHGVDLALDFLRVDVEAAGDHEILAAAENMHVILGVDLAEVARDEEAVVADLGFGLFRNPPVALEDVRSLDLDHADLVAWQFLAGLGVGNAHGDAG